MTQTKTKPHQDIELLESSSRNSMNSASSTLKHYFGLAIDELDWDHKSEIEGIVSDIVDAAVAKAKAEILKEIRSTLKAEELPPCGQGTPLTDSMKQALVNKGATIWS